MALLIAPPQNALQITPVKRMAITKDDVPRGIMAMIGASLLFAISSAIAKWQVATYPVVEVMALRSLSSFLSVQR